MIKRYQLAVEEYVSSVAEQDGIPQLDVSLVDGIRLGCCGLYLLNLTTDSRVVSELIYKEDLDKLISGNTSDRIQVKINSAFNKLQMSTIKESLPSYLQRHNEYFHAACPDLPQTD